eukprot:Sspe_Gene.42399::Locus_20583_Transcript_1_3_Confidence_0.429_Length_2537::g.42399::m.42399
MSTHREAALARAKAAWKRSSSPRQRREETIGSDPLVGFLPFLERLAKKVRLPVAFPETVVYEHHFPRGWYWFEMAPPVDPKQALHLIDQAACVEVADDEMRTINGDVLRTVRSKECETAAILDSLKRGSGCIVAQVVRRAEGGKLDIEYLDNTGLQRFLMKRSDHCLLSKFVAPKGKNNEVLLATWTPQRVLVERWRNNYEMGDSSKPLQTRGLTDNPVHCGEIFCPPTIRDLTSRIMQTLVREVEGHEKAKVVEFVAHFKLDTRSRLWLLWVPSLRLIPELPVPPGLDDALGSTPVKASGKITPGDPNILAYLGLSTLRNSVVDKRRRVKATGRPSATPMIRPMSSVWLNNQASDILSPANEEYDPGAFQKHKTHPKPRFFPLTLTGIRSAAPSVLKGGWPSFCPPQEPDPVDIPPDLLKGLRKKKRKRRIPVTFIVPESLEHPPPSPEQLPPTPPPSESDGTDVRKAPKSASPVPSPLPSPTVYCPPGGRPPPGSPSSFQKAVHQGFYAVVHDRNGRSEPAYLRMAQSMGISLPVSQHAIVTSDGPKPIHVTNAVAAATVAVVVIAGYGARPPREEVGSREAERLMLVERLSEQRRRDYLRDREHAKETLSALRDLEYAAYSYVLEHGPGSRFFFDLPRSCPHVGNVQDINLFRTRNHPTIVTDKEFCMEARPGHPPLLVVRQTMTALRERVQALLRRNEVNTLLRDLDLETMRTLRYHTMPRAPPSSPTLCDTSESVSSHTTGGPPKTVGLFTISNSLDDGARRVSQTAPRPVPRLPTWKQEWERFGPPPEAASDDSGPDDLEITYFADSLANTLRTE